MRNRRRWAICEWALLAVCAGLVGWQLFVPPSLGVADNNDFAKLIGRACLGGEHPLFEYVSFGYHQAKEYCWDSGLITSAVLPLRVAMAAANPFSSGRFDLRWLGAVYALLFLAAFVTLQKLARGLRPAARLVVPLSVVAVFGGASYVPWFNSFYFDTASYAFLWFAILASLRVMLRETVTTWDYLAALACTLLFETSKSQHTALALPLISCFWLRFGRVRFPGSCCTRPRRPGIRPLIRITRFSINHCPIRGIPPATSRNSVWTPPWRVTWENMPFCRTRRCRMRARPNASAVFCRFAA
jgi:hypothetical protein